ncbi:MAG: TlpA family protein disulfide reductase [Candidatus Kariarchaeaceae archaeon]|jgi:thiol-disulfide isomerase/thioredoxin
MRSGLLGLFAILFLVTSNVQAYSTPGGYANLSGETVQFSFFEGKPLVIEAIQTTCPACKDPGHRSAMNSLLESFSSEVNFLILTINTADDLEDMQDFMEAYEIQWQAGFDTQNIMGSYFAVSATPTTLLITEGGALFSKWQGHQPLETYVGALNNLLDTDISVENTYNPGGSQGPSVIENIFGNSFVQGGFVIFLILLIYFRSTGSKPETVE